MSLHVYAGGHFLGTTFEATGSLKNKDLTQTAGFHGGEDGTSLVFLVVAFDKTDLRMIPESNAAFADPPLALLLGRSL